MRLIDADALIGELQKDEEHFDKEAEDCRKNPRNYTDCYMQAMSSRADGIRDALIEVYVAPTIDPVAHGQWIDFNWEVGGDGIDTELCGVCGQWSYGMGKKYCPHCGAKMDGGEQRYKDEFDVCDSRNGCVGCKHHICKLEQTDERSE